MAPDGRPLGHVHQPLHALSAQALRRIESLFAAVSGILLAAIGFQQIFFDVPAADRPLRVLGTLLLGLGVQGFAIGLLGELLLFLNSRGQRDYRVQAIHESAPPSVLASDRQAELGCR